VTKRFLGSDETASRAEFGSWAVVWRPWFSALKCSIKSLKNMRGWQARLYQRAVDIPAIFIHKKNNFIKGGCKSLQDSSSAQTPDSIVHL